MGKVIIDVGMFFVGVAGECMIKQPPINVTYSQYGVKMTIVKTIHILLLIVNACLFEILQLNPWTIVFFAYAPLSYANSVLTHTPGLRRDARVVGNAIMYFGA
jgi:hypothetical protein